MLPGHVQRRSARRAAGSIGFSGVFAFFACRARKTSTSPGMLVRPFTQGRDVERHHSEAEVEVFAEASRVDGLSQVAVRRRQHPDVHPTGFARADRADFPVLKGAQQFRLERGG
jgi:hypothetical protein